MIVEEILSYPKLRHVYFDISGDKVAKYLCTPDITRRLAAMIKRYPDRLPFGSDVVAPKDTAQYYAVFKSYRPLWQLLTPQGERKGAQGSYERVFDARGRGAGSEHRDSEQCASSGTGPLPTAAGWRSLPVSAASPPRST